MGYKSDNSEENYKNDFEILMEDSKLQFYHKNIERSQPPLDYTNAGTKTSDIKIPATYSSACE